MCVIIGACYRVDRHYTNHNATVNCVEYNRNLQSSSTSSSLSLITECAYPQSLEGPESPRELLAEFRVNIGTCSRDVAPHFAISELMSPFRSPHRPSIRHSSVIRLSLSVMSRPSTIDPTIVCSTAFDHRLSLSVIVPLPSCDVCLSGRMSVIEPCFIKITMQR